MRSLEEAAFQRGVAAERLMDLAGKGIAGRLACQFPKPGHAVAYIGKGNNGGDALVALRHLRLAGWSISVRSAFPASELGELPARKLDELAIEPNAPVPASGAPLLLLDGLLGIGARGPLRDPLARLAEEMATLWSHHGATVAAMDLPSGMDPDTGDGDGPTADLTLTVGVPKRGLATPAGVLRSGRIVLVPLHDLPVPAPGDLEFFCPDTSPPLLPPRPHEFHKGNAGRVGLLAGSPGMTGAAVLAATAAVKAGAGLVTLHVEPGFLSSLAAPMPPEVMVRPSDDPVSDASDASHDALVIGPGTGNCGEHWRRSLLEKLASCNLPAVLDADALNLIATKGRHDLLGPHHLITPHPGEFRRLAPDLEPDRRVAAVSAFVTRHPCTLLLKGARSLVGANGFTTRFNPTGHAGMASGGQGDVLAGVAGALLAQGLSTVDAGSLAAWLCGRAGERALTDGPICPASSTLTRLGAAMRDWQTRSR